MSNVAIVSCDCCGKETRDRSKWIHLYAQATGFHQMNVGQLGVAHAPTAHVVVRGAFSDQFAEKDFCSPHCAGAGLFGLRRFELGDSPEPVPPTAGGLT